MNNFHILKERKKEKKKERKKERRKERKKERKKESKRPKCPPELNRNSSQFTEFVALLHSFENGVIPRNVRHARLIYSCSQEENKRCYANAFFSNVRHAHLRDTGLCCGPE